MFMCQLLYILLFLLCYFNISHLITYHLTKHEYIIDKNIKLKENTEENCHW